MLMRNHRCLRHLCACVAPCGRKHKEPERQREEAGAAGGLLTIEKRPAGRHGGGKGGAQHRGCVPKPDQPLPAVRARPQLGGPHRGVHRHQRHKHAPPIRRRYAASAPLPLSLPFALPPPTCRAAAQVRPISVPLLRVCPRPAHHDADVARQLAALAGGHNPRGRAVEQDGVHSGAPGTVGREGSQHWEGASAAEHVQAQVKARPPTPTHLRKAPVRVPADAQPRRRCRTVKLRDRGAHLGARAVQL
mmetsp:Transcript_25194/g.64878  ORF Transcript_25194/g.64878 Transcript_25194/m.64878 type:complete len:247 (+) Transcript_25194:338-1078(+)